MTAASVAALTVYDMVKGVERGVEIRAVRLLSKTGGKSGAWERADDPVDGGTKPRPKPGAESPAGSDRSASAADERRRAFVPRS